MNYRLKEAIPKKGKIVSDEFDLVIHMDHIIYKNYVAQIIACAFEQKFQVNFKHKK